MVLVNGFMRFEGLYNLYYLWFKMFKIVYVSLIFELCNVC